MLLAPDGNLSGVDAYFFGLSGTTESGLNVVDVNKMQLYQQLVIYFIPILGNMQVVSILILMVRFYWFTKYLKAKAGAMSQPQRTYATPPSDAIDEGTDCYQTSSTNSRNRVTWSAGSEDDTELPDTKQNGYTIPVEVDTRKLAETTVVDEVVSSTPRRPTTPPGPGMLRKSVTMAANASAAAPQTPSHITFAPEVLTPIRRSTAPANRSFDSHDLNDAEDSDEVSEKRGCHLVDTYSPRAAPGDSLTRTTSNEAQEASIRYRNRLTPLARSRGPSPDRLSFHRVVSNVFVLGGDDITPGVAGVSLQRARTNSMSRERSRSRSRHRKQSRTERLKLSANAMLGRNSNFVNLSEEDRDRLGGIEYRSLKLLLKIVVTYYISLHLIGIVCLTPWIHKTSESRYREYLVSVGVDKTWW